ncbi:helix-turn-helix transcriptional regulator [Priestia megaterium]|uniref:helix-turn-helix transcriptional regulator n=1 Tax=Priestia megaterium TaxID=1404 RepID=UPI0028778E67|nr:helix-turn-helix domain-containing protein [Priestia megaterium]
MERTKLIDLRGEKARPQTAKDLGITPQMLGAIERGDRTPSLPLAKKIADYYGKSVDEIFFTKKGNEMCPQTKV